MANGSGYSNYRGRRPLGKILLAAALVLVILAAAVFLALQKYMVYDENGDLRLEFPGRGDGGGSASVSSPISSADLNIIIDRKEPEEEKDEAPTAEISAAVQLADMPLTDWAAAMERLQSLEADAVCVTVKDDEGYVYVDSAVTASLSRRTVVVKDTTEQAIADMAEDEDLKSAVARISCLRDSRVPILDVRSLGLRQNSGYLFYDETGTSWLDPTKDAVIRYLTTLAQECAELGFDEILLTNVSYPTGGDLTQINYGENPKSANLAAFVKAVRSVLEGYDVKLSLELPAAVILEGSNSDSGQVFSELAVLADGIYARTTAEDAPRLAELVKQVSPETVFVAEVTDAEGIAADYLLVEE